MKILKVLLCLFFCCLFFNCEKIDEIYEWKNHFKKELEPKKKVVSYAGIRYSKEPVVNYILDSRDLLSIQYFKDITKICDYSKTPLNFSTFVSWNKKPFIPKTCKVLVVKNTLKLNQNGIDALLAFVAKGGTLFMIETTEDIRMGYLLGIKPRSNYEVDINVKGIYFEKNVLPGVSGVSIKPKEGHFGLKAENFSKKVNILAWADSDRKYPFFLENKVGAGKVVFFNSTRTFEKEDRGLLFAGILDGLKAIPYPVANTSTIFLDDFPSPTYDVKKEPIKTEMNINITDFVYSVWWPDMKKVAKDFNIKYTAMLTFDYRNKINPPFSFSQWDASRKIINGREFIVPHLLVNDLEKNGFEKGFHGYNHVSLLKKGWPYPEAIQSSMKATTKKWMVNSYGNLPISYVPPSNDIDAYGVANIKIAMPSIKYMSSIYLGDLKEGGDREYDFDPYNNQLFDYPRISSGYDMTDNVYVVKSLYLFTGIWNHFVHPDDVYQIPENMDKDISLLELRNPNSLGWHKTKGSKRSFLKLFTDYLTANKEQFPLTQYTTVAKAVPQVMHWRASKYKHTAHFNSYSVQEKKYSKIHHTKFNTSWFVYFEKQDYQKAESQIKKQTNLFSHTPFLNGRLYHIITTKSELNFKGFYHSNLMVDLNQIQNEYNEYLKDQKLYMAGAFDPAGEDYDLKLKLEKARLLALMLSQPEIDYAVWDKYAFYASWDNKGDEVWELLKKHCQKYPSKHNVMYSKNLAEILGYATPELQKYWITMQYKYNPDDLSILKEYLYIAYDAKDNAEIEKVLKRIYELETTNKNLQEYLAFILINNRAEAFKVLENIAPHANFEQNLVADISWLYASVNNSQKALDWSKHTGLIPFSSQLSWMYELCMYTELIEAYLDYERFCPEDYEVKATMVGLYHAMGQFKNAWDLACNLPNGDEKNKLIEMLNKDVIYVEESLQDILIKESPQCFTKEAMAFILDNRRKMFGDFVQSNSEYSTFSGRKINLTNSLSYNRYDKKKNLHTLKVTNNNLYAFSVDNLVEDQNDPDNRFLMIHGINYKFKSDAIKKWRDLSYFGSLGLEVSNDSKPYYNLSAGAEINKDYKSSSVQLDYAPANTSPAYIKNIYRLRATFYNNSYVGMFGVESSLELEYYNNPVVYNLMADSKMRFKPNRQKWFRSTPIAQLGILKSTASRDLFYPFFVFKEMIYGGLGAGAYLGKDEDRFKFTTEATYLKDTKYNTFYNLRGNVEYSFGKYVYLRGGYDFFFQNQYQSSTAQLGMKYIF